MARTRWPTGPGNPGLLPRPGRPDRQRQWVPTTGARPADRLAGQPRMASAESEVRPGPRPPTLRAYRRKTSEAVPGAPTHILPADSALLMAAPAARVPARNQFWTVMGRRLPPGQLRRCWRSQGPPLAPGRAFWRALGARITGQLVMSRLAQSTTSCRGSAAPWPGRH